MYEREQMAALNKQKWENTDNRNGNNLGMEQSGGRYGICTELRMKRVIKIKRDLKRYLWIRDGYWKDQGRARMGLNWNLKIPVKDRGYGI